MDRDGSFLPVEAAVVVLASGGVGESIDPVPISSHRRSIADSPEAERSLPEFQSTDSGEEVAEVEEEERMSKERR